MTGALIGRGNLDTNREKDPMRTQGEDGCLQGKEKKPQKKLTLLTP